MTDLLQQALLEVQKLSDRDQDAIAALILDELADETRWEEAFSRSPTKLAKLVQRANDDIAAGRVEQRGIDEL